MAAREQEDEAGIYRKACVDFVPEFAGESEECGWHGREMWYSSRILLCLGQSAQEDRLSVFAVYGKLNPGLDT